MHFLICVLFYILFGNNNLVWILQLGYVGLPIGFSISSSIVSYYCFYYFKSFINYAFSLDEIFFFVIQGTSFSLTGNVSFRIKLGKMFEIVLLRIKIQLVFTKALSQSGIPIARLIRSVFSSWQYQTSKT